MAKNADVYAYEFNDRGAPAPDPFRTLPFPMGASHSLELRYLFDIGGAPPLNPDQQVLSDQMIDAWTRFVRGGNPGPHWPKFGAGEDRWSLRPDGSRVETDFDDVHQCPFWAGVQGEDAAPRRPCRRADSSRWRRGRRRSTGIAEEFGADRDLRHTVRVALSRVHTCSGIRPASLRMRPVPTLECGETSGAGECARGRHTRARGR